MTVTESLCWRLFFIMLVILSMYLIGRLHLKLVTNIFWLQHPSPTSMSPSMLKVILPFTCPKSKPTSFTLSSCWVSIDQLETLVSDFYQYQIESMINSWFWSLRSSHGSIGQCMGLPSWEFRPLYAEPWLKSWKVLAMSFTSVLYTEYSTKKILKTVNRPTNDGGTVKFIDVEWIFWNLFLPLAHEVAKHFCFWC